MKPESSRPRRDVDEAAAEVAAATKIRRRCAPSSSSSSEPRSTRRRLRLKRRVRLIGQTGSPRKTTSSSRRMSESSRNRHHHRRLTGVETRPTSAASARKLVSALWQLDKGGGACEGEGDVGWDAAAARRSSDHHRRSASLELSNLARRKSNALEADGERGWHNGHAHGHWFSDVISNGGTMEATQGLASPCPSGDRTAQLRELYNSMTASKELVRVLANVLAPGALNPTAASLLVALRSELDVARARARQLAREQRRRGGDEVSAEERLAEEMREWKSRHREKAARVVASELDAERRARQRAERVSKKLGEALAGAEASLREARWELERERKARERLENEGEEEEEELRRREAERARQKLEREREMLQLADELREDRVRMNLAEARLQFEEKSAVVDRLRQELEAFLGRDDKDGRGSPAHDDGNAADDRRLQLVLASESVVNGIDRVAIHTNGEDGGGNDGCGEVGDDSDGSDIELNMDGNIRDYSWSHSTAASKATTAKNAASGSSRHGSISDRGTEGSSDRRSQGLGEAPERNWNNQECSDDDDDDVDRTTTKEDIEEDAERYEAIKNLREQMLAGHGFFSLSQQGGAADAGDRDHHRHPGFVCQVDQGELW